MSSVSFSTALPAQSMSPLNICWRNEFVMVPLDSYQCGMSKGHTDKLRAKEPAGRGQGRASRGVSEMTRPEGWSLTSATSGREGLDSEAGIGE